MNRETEMQKPTHKTYENDRNILYPEPYNAGLDEMEAYYEPLLGECLGALEKVLRMYNHANPFTGSNQWEKLSTIPQIIGAILAKRKGE